MASATYPVRGTVEAEPGPINLDWRATALLLIDMQRDFMEPGGFGETLGNDVSQLARAVKPIAARPATTSFRHCTRSMARSLSTSPARGAFYATELGDALQKHGIENLLVCGVTTEVCVNSTVREANDRGYRCVVLADGCASYFPEFHEMGLKMIKAQGGIFGWVSDSAAVLAAMAAKTSNKLAAGAAR